MANVIREQHILHTITNVVNKHQNVLIHNIFRFTTLKINAYLFFRRGYGKLIV